MGSFNKLGFAELVGLPNHKVTRWVKALPENHQKLLLWAEALGLPWQVIVTAEDDSAAIDAKPHAMQRPPPTGMRAVASRERKRARRRK